jgi:hydroxyacylglutathione hydrolase
MGLAVATVPVTPFQQNCALVFDQDSKQGAVVDPGGEVDRLLAAIDQRGVTVESILLTHGHLDHAGGAAGLKAALEERYGGTVPVIGPDQRDSFLLKGLAEQGLMFGISDMQPVTPDRWLEEGDTISIGGTDFIVLHCPGHTPGHVVFVAPDHRFAIVGDVLFRGSVGRTDFPYGDHQALIGSIHRKLLPLGDDIGFICGHVPSSTFGTERRVNPFL